MFRDDAVNLIAQRLGNRQELKTRIIFELELAMQTTLATGDFVPWFLEGEMSEGQTITNQERVQVPLDFLKEIEDNFLQVKNPSTGKWKNLDKWIYDRMDAEFAATANGLPRAYAISGQYFRLRPVPDAVYKLRMIYHKMPVSVALSNVENEWLKYAPDIPINAALAEMAAKHVHNGKLAAEARNDLKIGLERLFTMSEARRNANLTFSFGEDDGR